jgi:hypothetical protein
MIWWRRCKRLVRFVRLGSKGSIRSMSSKGCGFSSADVGVFTNHQRGRQDIGLNHFAGLMV